MLESRVRWRTIQRDGRSVPGNVHRRWTEVCDKLTERFEYWYLALGDLKRRPQRVFPLSKNKFLANMVPVVVQKSM